MSYFAEELTIKGKKFLLQVETSHKYDDYKKYENLRFEIWEEPEDGMPGVRSMVCENYFSSGSALFIAVYVADEEGHFFKDEGSFVGFSYGFVGVADKKIGFRDQSNLVFYSQFTGAREAFLEYGLGVHIKKFQKRVMLEIVGVNTISCTYDPLTGVNAYRNIHTLGMEVIDYKVAHYGVFGGRLNRIDVPCDRFFVYWHLKKELRKPDIDIHDLLDKNQLVLSSEIRDVAGKDGEIQLPVPLDLRLGKKEDVLLIEIPYDFYTMLRATDVPDENVRSIPMDWRLKSRKAFQALLGQGYRVVDFLPVRREERIRDFYVLKRLE